MPIELVVFDLAGTTVEDAGAVNACLRAALEAAGVSVSPTQVDAVMGLPKREALRRLLSSPAAQVEAVHADFERLMLRYYESDPAVREIPGTSATFARLKEAGIKVAVNSGFGRAIGRAVLDRLGWDRAGLLDGSVMSDEVPRGRPHPNMIRLLMDRLSVVDAGRVAKVGDTPADLEEGASAGCGLVVGVTTGAHSRDQLAQFPHTHLLESVADLPALMPKRVD
jgi:phosphonatase-like hydrolase